MNRVPRIHCPAQPLHPGKQLGLDRDTRHRLTNVLRLKPGAEIVLFNGVDAFEVRATVLQLDRKSAIVEITAREEISRESPLQTCLWQSVEKADRMDYAIQKAVELGVSCIQPVHTEYSLPPFRTDRLEKKMAHWRGVIIHACEQSGRCILPTLKPPARLATLLQERNPSNTGLIPDLDATTPLRGASIDTNGVIDILIGPIGGFTREEVAEAEKAGMQGISLGPRILRTETAGIAVLAWLQTQYGDMG